ncbi:unnamed protein product [Ilex paraguariensis]|uniref:Protein FAR1-RELATED SEQUENCE n=1 Tax=Ilex paraguariensis TaxID=185542 RepID=A0ABC8SCR0_9AQUA
MGFRSLLLFSLIFRRSFTAMMVENFYSRTVTSEIASCSVKEALVVMESAPDHEVPKPCQVDESENAGEFRDGADNEEPNYGNQGNYDDDDMSGEEGSDDGSGDSEDDADAYGNGGSDDNDKDDDEEDGEEHEEEDDEKEQSVAASSDDTTDSEEDMDDHLYSLLRHAREVYSPNNFHMFEHEHKKSRTLGVDVVWEDSDARGLIFEYKLEKFGHHFRHHTVTALPCDGIINCSCNYFEISGILCSHSQTVLRCLRIEKIPEHYLPKRTKKGRCDPVEEHCCLKDSYEQLQSSSPCSHNSRLMGACIDDAKGSEDGRNRDADLVDAPLLRHARDVYISEAVDMFQEEYKESEYHFADVVDETYDHRGIVVECEVRKPGHYSYHKVHAESANGIVNCSCKNFEYTGILCRHAVCVLDSLCIVRIPAQYILESFDELMNMAAKSDQAQYLIEQTLEELTTMLSDTSKNHNHTETGEASLVACERENFIITSQEQRKKKQICLLDGQTLKDCIEELKTKRCQCPCTEPLFVLYLHQFVMHLR